MASNNLTRMFRTRTRHLPWTTSPNRSFAGCPRGKARPTFDFNFHASSLHSSALRMGTVSCLPLSFGPSFNRNGTAIFAHSAGEGYDDAELPKALDRKSTRLNSSHAYISYA